MATANEEFRDALLRHQVGLLRLSAGIRTEVIALLNDTEADLRREIERRLASMPKSPGLTSAKLKKLQAMREVIATLRGAAIDETYDVWNERMRELVRQERDFVAGATRTVSPVQLDVVLPPINTLTALVSKMPFHGRTLKQWSANMKQQDLDRIMDTVKIGMVQGQSIDQISRSVFGTISQAGKNGILQMTRNNAEAITRTAVNHFSNQSKRIFYEANDDIYSEEVYVATLDGRTTPICRSLDGKRFPIGEGPRPPLHFGCRSVRVALIGPQLVGDRPARRFTEKQLVREFNGGKGTSRDDIPHGRKGEFDRFAQRRKRELTGTVPAADTYQKFLERQPASFQNDVLGKTKGALFRRGGLTLDRFVNRQGDELTLAELARRDREAFLRAGLNPEDFL